MTRRSVVWTFALTLACAWPAAAVQRPDAWITARTKIALFAADAVPASDIDVDTTEGRVTLHGTVRTEAEKAEAARVARGVDGVRDVRNLLQVVSAPEAESVRVADDDLAERVRAALARDERLADSDVDVASVNDGVVLLEGEARTIGDHLRAVETAAGVPGVRRVASRIESPDRESDAEIHRDRTADDAVAGAKSGVSDAYVTTATKLKLLADERVPGLEVNVDTRNGRVTLFGVVPTKEAKAAAEEVARGVSGVRAVENELQVVPERRRDAVAASDGDVREQVERALDAAESLREADIDVEVKNGVARLTGTVRRPEQRLTAAIVARRTAGVRAVHEELRVRN